MCKLDPSNLMALSCRAPECYGTPICTQGDAHYLGMWFVIGAIELPDLSEKIY